jgi:hypothetical protein
MSALELRKREVIAGIHKGREVSEDLKSVFTALFFRDFFFVKVVGEIGGEALAPIALAVIDPNGVAPPAVSDLVSQTGLDDERKPDDRASKKRVGRKSVAGGEEILNDGKLLKGVRPNQFFI